MQQARHLRYRACKWVVITKELLSREMGAGQTEILPNPISLRSVTFIWRGYFVTWA